MKTILIPVPENTPERPPTVRATHIYEGKNYMARMVPDSMPNQNGYLVLEGDLDHLVEDGILTPIPPPFVMLKNKRLREVKSAFDVAVAGGITVQGITLRAADADRNAFAQLLVMLREAEALQAAPESVSIADITGATHAMTVAGVRALLVAYGAAYQRLWLSMTAAKNAVAAAANQADLDAIELPQKP